MHKVPIKDFVLNLPDEPTYIFQYGSRIAWAIIPIWTTWNESQLNKPEEIYEYRVIGVSNSFTHELHSFTWKVEGNHIETVYNRGKKSGGTSFGDREYRLLHVLITDGLYQERMIRTREQWEKDFRAYIDHVTEFSQECENPTQE